MGIIKLLALGFFILIFCMACRPSHPIEYSRITVAVDSTRSYSLDSLSLNGFEFSPLPENDIIWVYTNKGLHQLNLVSGAWMPFRERFHLGPTVQLPLTEIWKDSITQEVFCFEFHRNLFYNPIQPDTFYQWSLEGLTCLMNTKDEILVGTAKGLFYINKRNLKISKSPDISLKTWIHDMEAMGQDTLSINKGQIKIHKKMENVGHFIKRIRYDPYSRDKFLDSLPQTITRPTYRTYGDRFGAIYVSDEHFFYRDPSRHLFDIPQIQGKGILDIKTDDKYWFIVYNDKFVIVNKQYARTISSPFDYKSAFDTQEICKKKLIDLLNMRVEDFLNNVPGFISDTNCRQLFGINNGFEERVQRYFMYINPESKVLVEQLYIEGKIPELIEKYVLFGIINHYIHAYNLKKVNEYIVEFDKKYPEENLNNSRSTLNCFKRIIQSEDSLTALHLPEDEFLFKEAKIKGRLVQCGWFGDNYYDLSLQAENYQLILKKFPKSKYAEEIEFYSIGTEDFDEESGAQYSENGIKSIDQYLKNNPNSRFEPQLRMRKASILETYYVNPDSIAYFKDLALQELLKIDSSSIKDTLLRAELRYTIKRIEWEKFESAFDFSVFLPRTDFNLGDSISCIVTLKNKSLTKQVIQRYKVKPFFPLNISSEKKWEYIPNTTLSDTSLMQVTVLPGQAILDTIWITKSTRLWNHRIPGKIKFDKGGSFNIGAFLASPMGWGYGSNRESLIYINE